ncbi:MAG: redoxin domain-containing protein [Verrucomicrobia bacterium]|nr:redoxin domain-containing protein [Verrucomicrobiota bacterium]
MLARLLISTAATAVLLANNIQSQPTPAPNPGAVIEAFHLYDIHRRQRSLDDYSGKKAFAIVFVGTECPLANLYLPRLAKLHEEFGEKEIQFLAINSNPQDSFVRFSAHAQEREVPFPVLKDFDQKIAKSLGASRTPEVFLLDSNRTIRYHGRIDDQYTVTHRRVQAGREDLRIAIEELLDSKPVTVAETTATGCLIRFTESPRIVNKVTYSSDIAEILQRRCQECHRPGQVAPFSLLTYEKARGWAETIHEVVLEQRMPPWHADSDFGAFSNERRLTHQERETLLAWIEQGCPEGDKSEIPPAKEFPVSWTIGTPDRIIQMPITETVPADGVVPYRYYDVDPGFTEDVWIQSAEAMPGNRKVVHHVIAYIVEPGKKIFTKEGEAAILVGWAPGDMPAIFPNGVARRIAAGSKLRFEVHYTPNGKETTDRSQIGIIFAKEEPKREVHTNILWNRQIQIPPNTASHSEKASYTFPADAQILSFMPHMHWRGLRAHYSVKYPDGRKERILSVPDYDFNWQSVYRFAKPFPVSQGSTVSVVGYWDNSSDNPANPDPSRTVPWGEQTWDEMLNGWVEFVFDHEDQAKQREVAKVE